LDGHPTDLLGNPLGPVAVKVCDQNSLRAFHGKSSTECSTDSVRSAGDNHYFARDVHNLSSIGLRTELSRPLLNIIVCTISMTGGCEVIPQPRSPPPLQLFQLPQMFETDFGCESLLRTPIQILDSSN
jgi:hypothetical protein